MRSPNPDTFDLFSYGRPGPERPESLSPSQIALIAHTARRTPEVMVKVLQARSSTLTGVRRHLDYVGRKGDVDLQTDDGQLLRGRDVSAELLDDWDLDLEDHRRQSNLSAGQGRAPPRLVYKVVFSMPAGTAPEKVLTAAQTFCRERFALEHRYVLALHTDEPHPHVHAVIKAVSEQGRRLNLKKATLREWRAEFARHLRAVGVAANATPRVIRGQTRPRKSDRIYRAARRGDSTYYRQRVQALAAELRTGERRLEPGKLKLIQTRQAVEHGWRAIVGILEGQGERALAAQTLRFVSQLPPPQTEREHIRLQLLDWGRTSREQDRAMTATTR